MVIKISTLAELQSLTDSTESYELTNDINCNNTVINPIFGANIFTGTFDGKGFKIYNFSNINTVERGYGGYELSAAPFAMMRAGGLIKNLGVQGTINRAIANVTGAGMIAHAEAGTVQNCWASVNVTAGTMAGGFVGWVNTSSFINCYCTGNVAASTASSTNSGGFVGFSDSRGVFNNCFARGNATGPAGTSHKKGGFQPDIGYSPPNINNSYYTGSPQTGFAVYVTPASDILEPSHPVYAGDLSPEWDTDNDWALFSGKLPELRYAPHTTDIDSWIKLQGIRHKPDEDYVLTQSLTQYDEGYTTFGLDWKYIEDFSGSIDGQGNTISGIILNKPTEDNVGLISNVAGDCEIKNLILDLFVITARDNVGLLVGNNSNYNVTFDDVKVNGSITARNRVGGFTGLNNNCIFNNCISNVNISGTTGIGGFIGGYKDYSFDDCESSGILTYSGSSVGGFIGQSQGIAEELYTSCSNNISSYNIFPLNTTAGTACGMFGGLSPSMDYVNCEFKGFVMGANNIGGIIIEPAENSTINLNKCINEGTLIGVELVGGLSVKDTKNGSNLNIYNSKSKATIIADSIVGGLIAQSFSGLLQSSSFEGTILPYNSFILNNRKIGGLVGVATDGTIENCFSMGNIPKDSYGIIAENLGVTIQNCSWLKKECCWATPQGDLESLNSGDDVRDISRFYDSTLSCFNDNWGEWLLAPGDLPKLKTDYAVWTGTGNFSDNDNWSRPITSSDLLLFDSTSVGNCIIDVDSRAYSIVIDSSYTGTITQEAKLSVNGFLQEGGSFICEDKQNIPFNSRYIKITGGVFDR